MNKTDLAYIAGLFDGDGCITINNHQATGYGSLRCILTTTDEATVIYLKEEFGGHCQVLKRRKDTWRKVFGQYSDAL